MKIKLKLLVSALIVGLNLIPSLMRSQHALNCNYSINSSYPCTLTWQVEFFDSCPPSVACDTQNGTVSQGIPVFITCHGCSTLCEIRVTINGVSFDSTSYGNQVNCGTQTPCTDNIISVWDGDNTDCSPHP